MIALALDAAFARGATVDHHARACLRRIALDSTLEPRWTRDVRARILGGTAHDAHAIFATRARAWRLRRASGRRGQHRALPALATATASTTGTTGSAGRSCARAATRAHAGRTADRTAA